MLPCDNYSLYVVILPEWESTIVYFMYDVIVFVWVEFTLFLDLFEFYYNT